MSEANVAFQAAVLGAVQHVPGLGQLVGLVLGAAQHGYGGVAAIRRVAPRLGAVLTGYFAAALKDMFGEAAPGPLMNAFADAYDFPRLRPPEPPGARPSPQLRFQASIARVATPDEVREGVIALALVEALVGDPKRALPPGAIATPGGWYADAAALRAGRVTPYNDVQTTIRYLVSMSRPPPPGGVAAVLAFLEQAQKALGGRR